MYEGIDRFTAGWFENLLIPVWLPHVPHVLTKLQNGARVADVGCGRGRALIKLAKAFPESRSVGYEIYGPNVDIAIEKVRATGLSDRITIRHADASEGLSGRRDAVRLDRKGTLSAAAACYGSSWGGRLETVAVCP